MIFFLHKLEKKNLTCSVSVLKKIIRHWFKTLRMNLLNMNIARYSEDLQALKSHYTYANYFGYAISLH